MQRARGSRPGIGRRADRSVLLNPQPSSTACHLAESGLESFEIRQGRVDQRGTRVGFVPVILVACANALGIT